MTSTITSREVDRDVAAAMQAAERGPVMITDRGQPIHVLVTAAEFERISGWQQLLGDLLRRGQDPTIEFDLLHRRLVPEWDLDP
ncbi:MAG: type II toxin-antitoxin system Phd/YefM family antitoxin [Kocuria palustris]|nr:MAG: type II toxin-antitoxin system Phd/YefM family antitoxin [Kocuria palustris]